MNPQTLILGMGIFALIRSFLDRAQSGRGGKAPSASPGGLQPRTDYERITQQFGKRVVDVGAFPETKQGFQQFLTATGIRFTKADELTRPNHPDIAARHGYADFTPPKDLWERSAALAAIFDHVRSMVGAPVTIRNAWRPASYNTDVGGSPRSDHVGNQAFDLDFGSAEEGRIAICEFLRIQREYPWMEMSLGVSDRYDMVHFGVLSEPGRRSWRYRGGSVVSWYDSDLGFCR